MAFEGKDLLFYSVPIVIAGVAGYFAFRYFHDGPPREPPQDEQALARKVDPCFIGRFRCRDGAVEQTTGERGDADQCVWKSIDRCATACVAEKVTLFGPSAAIARTQLCDAPDAAGSFAELVVTPEGATCDHDGFGPAPGGLQQCILKSGNDPDAQGLVVETLRCKTGRVETEDVRPQLVSREQAIAVWCRRDHEALAEFDAGLAESAREDAGADANDAASDGAKDAVSDGPSGGAASVAHD